MRIQNMTKLQPIQIMTRLTGLQQVKLALMSSSAPSPSAILDKKELQAWFRTLRFLFIYVCSDSGREAMHAFCT